MAITIIDENCITVFSPQYGTNINVYNDNYNFEVLKKALVDNDQAKVDEIITKEVNKLYHFSNGQIEEDDKGKLIIDGEEVPLDIYNKINYLQSEGLNAEPILNFWKNLKLNPSFNSRKQLFNFINKNKWPLTDKGCFLAYKYVSANPYQGIPMSDSELQKLLSKQTARIIYKGGLSEYKDKLYRAAWVDTHSNSVPQDVEYVVETSRDEVDDNPGNTCSYGLHVAGYNYIGNSGDAMLFVSVNPKDVVSVPNDYDFMKIRTSKYTILGVCSEMPKRHEIDKEYLGSDFFKTEDKIYDDYELDEWEDEWEDESQDGYEIYEDEAQVDNDDDDEYDEYDEYDEEDENIQSKNTENNSSKLVSSTQDQINNLQLQLKELLDKISNYEDNN